HNGLSTVLGVQLATDIEDVLLDRVYAEDQMRSDLPIRGAIEEQPQDLTFTAREWFYESTGMGNLEMSICCSRFTPDCQQSRAVSRYSPLQLRLAEQGHHRWSFIQEETDVALRFGPVQNPAQDG